MKENPNYLGTCAAADEVDLFAAANPNIKPAAVSHQETFRFNNNNKAVIKSQAARIKPGQEKEKQ